MEDKPTNYNLEYTLKQVNDYDYGRGFQIEKVRSELSGALKNVTDVRYIYIYIYMSYPKIGNVIKYNTSLNISNRHNLVSIHMT